MGTPDAGSPHTLFPFSPPHCLLREGGAAQSLTRPKRRAGQQHRGWVFTYTSTLSSRSSVSFRVTPHCGQCGGEWTWLWPRCLHNLWLRSSSSVLQFCSLRVDFSTDIQQVWHNCTLAYTFTVKNPKITDQVAWYNSHDCASKENDELIQLMQFWPQHKG